MATCEQPITLLFGEMNNRARFIVNSISHLSENKKPPLLQGSFYKWLILFNQGIHQRNNQWNEYRRSKGCNGKTGYKETCQPDDEAVNHKVEQAECQESNRQGQDCKDRFDDRIEQAEHKGGQQGGHPIVYDNPC